MDTDSPGKESTLAINSRTRHDHPWSVAGVKEDAAPRLPAKSSMQHHLRAQITLTPTSSGGRKDPIPQGEFRTVLVTGGHHFSASLFPEETIIPGGIAVHCSVRLLDSEAARGYFRPGVQFEVWEGGRKGYGFVLGSW